MRDTAHSHILTAVRALVANARAHRADIFRLVEPELVLIATGRFHNEVVVAELGANSNLERPSWQANVIAKVVQDGTLVLVYGGGDLTCLCLPVKPESGSLMGVVCLEWVGYQVLDTAQLLPIELMVAQVADQFVLENTLVVERDMLRTVVDAIPDHVFVKDTLGRYVVANQSIAQQFGLQSPKLMIGKTDFDFFPAENVMHIYEDEQSIVRSRIAHIDHREPNCNLGAIRWFSATKVPIVNDKNEVTGIAACCRDITLYKSYEDGLERRNAELAQLNAMLVQTQEKLVRAEKLAALGAIVAGVAHEMNTPLGNALLVASTLGDLADNLQICVTAGTLKRASLDQFLEQSKQGAASLVRQLGIAGNLVTRFKQLSITQGPDQAYSFDLKSSLEGAVLLCKPALMNERFSLLCDFQTGITMVSYPSALGDVVANLISNALMHAFVGRDHGTMTLTSRQIGGMPVELVFLDDGVGMSKEHLSRVFDPFFTTRFGQGGSGLGMNIVYNIVTGLLQGSIHVESDLGVGTQVSIQLPLVL